MGVIRVGARFNSVQKKKVCIVRGVFLGRGNNIFTLSAKVESEEASG